MNYYSKYYLLESGELKIAADKYREDRKGSIKEIYEYATSLGAIGVSIGLGHKIAGFVFHTGESPSDFTKPGKHGLCRPKNKKKYAKFYEFETPWAHQYLNGLIDPPTSLTWRYKDNSGSYGMTSIGNPIAPVAMYWYSSDSPVMLVVPDATKRAIELRNELAGKEIIFDDAADEWSLNIPGAREILLEEYEFMKAKHKAAQK